MPINLNPFRVLLALVSLLSFVFVHPSAAQDNNLKLVPRIKATSSVPEEGAGIIVQSEPGVVYILTAFHVVESAERIQVLFYRNKEEFEGEVVKVDEGLDLALLKVEGNLPDWELALQYSLQTNIEVGSSISSIGHPVGYTWDTNISNKVKSDRVITDTRKFTITSTGITAGCSGGPVFDGNGHWAGMITETNQIQTVCVKTETIRLLMDYWGYKETRLISLSAGDTRQTNNSDSSKIQRGDTFITLLTCFESNVQEDLTDQYGPYLLSTWEGVKGMFCAGIRGILYYSGLNSCFASLNGTGEELDFYNLRPIEDFAGMRAFLWEEGTKYRWDIKFSHVNPEIVIWGYENLIPDPDIMVLGESCQSHYDNRYKRFFRLMAASYVHIHGKMDMEQEIVWYKQNLYNDRDYQGLTKLEYRYGNILPGYDTYAEDIYSPWKSAHSFGFWVRRSIDGSDKELWTGLQKLLNTYDKAFLKDLLK